MRGSAPAHDHVFGDRLAHLRHRNAFHLAREFHRRRWGRRGGRRRNRRRRPCRRRFGSGLFCCSTLLDVAQDVALRNSAVDPRSFAGQGRQVDAMFLRDPPHQWRRSGTFRPAFFAGFLFFVSFRHGAVDRSRSFYFFGRFLRGFCRACFRCFFRGFLRSFFPGFLRSFLRRLSRRRRSIADHGDNGVDLHGLAFLDQNVLNHTRSRRWNFGVDFVGGNFEQRLVTLNLVTLLLEPLRNRAFKNTFPHLGHDDFCVSHECPVQ